MKKYLFYYNIKHKFNKKYHKILKNTTYNVVKNPRHEIDIFTKPYIIKT